MHVACGVISVIPDLPTTFYKLNSEAQNIIQFPDHPLRAEFELLPSGKRFRSPKAKSNRMKNSLETPVIAQLKPNFGI